jgi:hypothetical protein
MQAKMSLKRASSIAGKDAVAIALIGKGFQLVELKQYVVGGACLVLGIGLLVIENYLVG